MINNGCHLLIVLIYVDDLIFLGNSEWSVITETSDFLKIFEWKDDSAVSWYLSADIKLRNDVCTFSQTSFIDETVSHFGMQDAKYVYTPLYETFFDELLVSKTQPAKWADADFAGDKVDRKSRSCFVSTYGNSLFSWWSRKQVSNSQFTAEAEYIAMSECANDEKWLRLFMEEI